MNGRLYVVAGEMSGDMHAAGLLRALITLMPGLEVRGAGGPVMQEVAGSGVHDWLDQAAVMGVVEVLKHYRFFKDSFERMLSEVKAWQPDVLLLVDYPGFNLRFAAAVRKELPQVKIVQYVCPQVWAWKKGRIPKMAAVLDEVLCLLPFEPKVFEGSGLKASFAGHPIIDELSEEHLGLSRNPSLVALLPGSRVPEVEKLFPLMLGTAERMLQSRPELQFAVPAANARLATRIRELAAGSGLGAALEVRDGGAHRLMQEAACGVVASGTATVEAAFFGLPYCLVYRLAWPTYLIAKMVVKIEHIGLINILAGETVIEEFIQSDAEPCSVSQELERMLDHPEEVVLLQARLAEVIATLGGTGAHEKAAQAVARWFPEPSTSR
ncbi:lipid-A-disaccharide synthase [Haloferula luteola]|uniref:Lipid-A-disaccharide synthase n=1 Tax=Haloferula luteola TaxID=595692 RepID=A0A840V5U1_9BACT|nr:lipid-A-disaccharide synthase [Haloferula luteola]MBB5353617.1 lipid-A-disaccharide synthase [Haloferula luteola]